MAAVPTFVGLGVLKAGTTLLHTWLAEHPDIAVPADRKEVNFFSHYYDRGFDWYCSLFPGRPSAAVGEFSISYLHSPEALRRLHHELPDARCLVALRDPVARLESQYRHFAMVAGYTGTCTEFLHDHPNAVDRSTYGPQLRRLFTIVPREQVQIMVFEDFVADPEGSARDLYAFLGVDPSFVPPSLHARVNTTKQVRWPRVFAAKEAVSRFATANDLRWLLRLGRRVTAERLLLRAEAAPERLRGLDDAAATRLHAAFRADVAATSDLLGRDLAQIWRRGAPATAGAGSGPDGPL